MANKMLIDATHPEETRVVVLRGNRVEEFDFETAHRKQLRGNIYLAKVTRVEPSLQAAFVEYGGNRHGFLAFSEIHPDYYQIPVADRQALIEDDARAARESDAEQEHRGHRGGRRRQRASARREEVVQSDTLATEQPPHEVEIAAGEDILGAPLAEPSVASAAPEDVPLEAAPIGETENPPTPGEIAVGAEQAMAAEGEAIAEQATSAESAPADQSAAPIEQDGTQPAARADEPNGDGNGNGHGAEEEEEVVESIGGADAMEEVPDRAPRYRRQYKIQEVIKRRQVLLVQVVKEERGTKGAALTTYLSLAGRYCVLMPNTARGGGISRKITSVEDRKKLREIAEDLDVPDGMGVILRTAGASRTKTEVKRDFEYLLRLWEQVRDMTLRSTAPTLVYEEGSLAKRSIRDLYTKDIDEIVVAGEQGYTDSKEFMRMLMPSHAKNVKLYKDSQPIFTRYGIESQLDAMFSPTVQLRSGGYIVINQTEALVSIDVNSGRSTREHHIEDTALKTNVEAAEEVARQLRLRDLAGLIVIDFIDMDEKRNNRTVERRLKDALRNDRARIQVGRISHFGLMEMSRQRIRTSVLESSTEKCTHCGGTGHVRSVSSVSLQLLRSLEDTLLKGPTHNLIVRTRPEIALYVLNHKRAHLRALEERFHIAVTVNADTEVAGLVGFVIDRGEQVMTPEQARALIAQAEAGPVIVEEEEPADIEAAEEMEAEGEPEEAAASAGGVEPSAEERVEDETREGGRGRRRRRRRGRGRGGEGREPGAFEPGRVAPDMVAEHAVAEGDEFAPMGALEPAQPGAAEASSQPAHAEGEAYEGNGERRRRRRGRRGGRRNRRDRERPESGEFGAAPEQESRVQPESRERPEWSQPHEMPQPFTTEASFAAREEPPAPPPIAAQPAAAAPEAQPASASEPQRRRSTVREPAPMFGVGTPVAVPVPPPTPQPPPMVVTSSGESEEANKPRRTGWWARRMLGGDKG
jgi:ribonuclease E